MAISFVPVLIITRLPTTPTSYTSPLRHENSQRWASTQQEFSLFIYTFDPYGTNKFAFPIPVVPKPHLPAFLPSQEDG